MKKILYVTNHEVPYRVEFFNKLSKKTNLTVIYESRKTNIRNRKWSESISNNGNYNIIYLSEKEKQKKYTIKIFKYLFRKV